MGRNWVESRSKQVEGGRNPIEMGSKGSKAGSKVAPLPRNGTVKAGRRWSKRDRNEVESIAYMFSTSARCHKHFS